MIFFSSLGTVSRSGALSHTVHTHYAWVRPKCHPKHIVWVAKSWGDIIDVLLDGWAAWATNLVRLNFESYLLEWYSLVCSTAVTMNMQRFSYISNVCRPIFAYALHVSETTATMLDWMRCYAVVWKMYSSTSQTTASNCYALNLVEILSIPTDWLWDFSFLACGACVVNQCIDLYVFHRRRSRLQLPSWRFDPYTDSSNRSSSQWK